MNKLENRRIVEGENGEKWILPPEGGYENQGSLPTTQNKESDSESELDLSGDWEEKMLKAQGIDLSPIIEERQGFTPEINEMKEMLQLVLEQNKNLNEKITKLNQKILEDISRVADEIIRFKTVFVPMIIRNSERITALEERMDKMQSQMEEKIRIALEINSRKLEAQIESLKENENRRLSRIENILSNNNPNIFQTKIKNEDSLLEKLIDKLNKPEEKPLIHKINAIKRLIEFDGQNYMATDFLLQIEQYYEMADIKKDTDKIMAFSTVLAGKAVRWYTTTRANFQTWADLKQNFIENFQDTFTLKEKFREWKATNIYIGMDLEDHILRGLDILDVLYPAMAFDEKAQKVISRLPLKIKEQMRFKVEKFNNKTHLRNTLRSVLNAISKTREEQNKYYNKNSNKTNYQIPIQKQEIQRNYQRQEYRNNYTGPNNNDQYNKNRRPFETKTSREQYSYRPPNPNREKVRENYIKREARDRTDRVNLVQQTQRQDHPETGQSKPQGVNPPEGNSTFPQMTNVPQQTLGPNWVPSWPQQPQQPFFIPYKFVPQNKDQGNE